MCCKEHFEIRESHDGPVRVGKYMRTLGRAYMRTNVRMHYVRMYDTLEKYHRFAYVENNGRIINTCASIIIIKLT